MAQIFGTNPSTQALIEASVIKADPKWEKKEAESKKQAKAAHCTHKEACKKMLGHIGAAVDAHGDGDPRWHHTAEMQKTLEHLMAVHKYLSPAKYENDAPIVPSTSPVRSY